MEETRIPLRHWCWAFWQVCASKKGAAAKQIQRQTRLSYKSVLFLLHRVRFALADMQGVRLTGTVECDETYVGGKPRYKGPHNKRGRGTSKTPVFGRVERGERVHTRVVPDVAAKTLKSAIREVVDNQATIMTDENSAYTGIGAEFAGGYKVVCHSAREYVNGDNSTNTARVYSRSSSAASTGCITTSASGTCTGISPNSTSGVTRGKRRMASAFDLQ